MSTQRRLRIFSRYAQSPSACTSKTACVEPDMADFTGLLTINQSWLRFDASGAKAAHLVLLTRKTFSPLGGSRELPGE